MLPFRSTNVITSGRSASTAVSAGYRYRAAWLQPVLSVDYDLISLGDALGNQRDVTLGQIDHDWLETGVTVFYGVDVSPLSSALNSGQRDHDSAFADSKHQADVNKLVRPKRQVAIGKF